MNQEQKAKLPHELETVRSADFETRPMTREDEVAKLPQEIIEEKLLWIAERAKTGVSLINPLTVDGKLVAALSPKSYTSRGRMGVKIEHATEPGDRVKNQPGDVVLTSLVVDDLFDKKIGFFVNIRFKPVHEGSGNRFVSLKVDEDFGDVLDKNQDSLQVYFVKGDKIGRVGLRKANSLAFDNGEDKQDGILLEPGKVVTIVAYNAEDEDAVPEVLCRVSVSADPINPDVTFC